MEQAGQALTPCFAPVFGAAQFERDDGQTRYDRGCRRSFRVPHGNQDNLPDGGTRVAGLGPTSFLRVGILRLAALAQDFARGLGLTRCAESLRPAQRSTSFW